MNVKYFAIACSVMILLFIVELIRREKMTFKYAVTWLTAGLLVLGFSIYDRFLGSMARLAGFELTSNFIFFLFLVLVVFLSLLLTIYTNEQNRRNEILTQSVAILEYRLGQFEQRFGQKSGA